MPIRSRRTLVCTVVATLAVGQFVADAVAQVPGLGGGGPNSSLLRGPQRKKPEVAGISLSATGEQVVDLRIEGNRTIPTSQITSQLQTREDRPFDPKIVQRDVRKLASLGWFVDIKPLYEKTPEGRIVIFQVVERPTIRYVEFLGNVRIRDKKLAKEIGLKVGGPVDPFAVEEGRRKLLSLYKRNGFNHTQISIREGSESTDQGVVYVVHEGVSQRIKKVKFVGVDFVPARRLKTRIESKRPTMWLFKGFLDQDQLEADKNRLIAFYRSFGFFQANVGTPIVEFNDKGNWATVTFVVHEGPRYQVRNVTFMGNELFADSSLTIGMTLPAGESFEQAKMNADLEWLKELYGSQGYVFADIRAEPVYLEEPGQLDLVYHFEEGKRWRVGRILVNINGEHTHSRIQTALNRLSLQPGEIVDIREVRASERRLQASGLFLSDPIQGIAPKITFRIPELDGVELGGGGSPQRGAGFRGQSPDDTPQPAPRYRSIDAGMYEVQRPVSDNGARSADYDAAESIDICLQIGNDDGPPVLPPPTTPPAQSTPQSQSQSQSRSKAQSQSQRQPPPQQPQRPAASPSARRHVAMRPPYEDQYQYPRQQAAAPSGGNRGAYGEITVRTQSPYQPAPARPTYPTPSGYGGRLPGATGPAAAPIGYSSGTVQQAQYTGPLPPPQSVPPAPARPGQPALPPDPNVTPLQGDPGLVPASPLTPGAAPWMEPAVDVVVDVAEAQTGRFMIGAGINSNAGVVGQILLDERNFDWRRPPRSFNDFATGRAWRGAGQRFRLEAAPGTQVQRYLASFQEPYLWDTPVSLGLSGSYFNRRYRDWDEQRAGGRVSLGYQWVQYDLSTTLAYRGELINIHDPAVPFGVVPELDEALGDNELHGFRWGVANDTRDSAFFPTEGHFIELAVEQVVGTFQYPRATIDINEYALIHERPDHSGRHVISGGTRLGFTGPDTPIYDNFYAGGFSSLRGFDFRGASPVKSGVEVGGEFMWINTVEYLFPLTADDMIHGVVFVDWGTVEENITLDWDHVRVSPGFGLRLTVPAMGPAPIALDFAWAAKRVSTDDLQVFSFNVGFTR